MGLKSAPYYWIECDHEGCGVKSTEGGDFSAWSDSGDAANEADDSGWAEVGDKWLCDKHWTTDDDDEPVEL